MFGKRTHAYFVGRRPFEAAELYAVSAAEVQRLRPTGRYDASELDWHGSDSAVMELSHVLLTQIVDARPSERVDAWFAMEVLAQLPHEGFVLDRDDIRRWLGLVAGPREFFEAEAPRRSRT